MNLKAIRIYGFCLISCWFITPAYANLPVFFSVGGGKSVKAIDLPDKPPFQTEDGKNIDLGYRYQHVSIFFIPVWNYNVKWCGYVGSDKEYLDLNYEGLTKLTQAANIKLPESPSLDFWNSVGGKLLFGSILLLFIRYKMKAARS